MFVPVSKPLFDGTEAKLVAEAMNRGDISGFKGTLLKNLKTSLLIFVELIML